MVDGIFGHPARIAKLDDELKAAVLGRVSGVTESEVFMFPAVVSTDRLDAYFTRMDESSLRNYADDLAAGVALQNSHRHMELPFGRSVFGEFSGQATTGVFYTVRDLNLNGVNTNDLIRGIETGILSDVSIGFSGGKFECSICKRELWSTDCLHVPGLTYDGVTAFVWVRGARLAETSVVYDGATPGAAIIKARMESEAGRLRPDAADVIEQRYRIKLPDSRAVWSVQQEGKVDIEVRLREVLGLAEEVDLVEAVTSERAAMTETQERIRSLQAKISELEPQARDGQQYRDDLINAALVEGVRAVGSEFAQDTYREVMKSAPLDVIKRMRDDWKAIADKVFVAGRASQDKADRRKPVQVETPNAAFAA